VGSIFCGLELHTNCFMGWSARWSVSDLLFLTILSKVSVRSSKCLWKTRDFAWGCQQQQHTDVCWWYQRGICYSFTSWQCTHGLDPSETWNDVWLGVCSRLLRRERQGMLATHCKFSCSTYWCMRVSTDIMQGTFPFESNQSLMGEPVEYHHNLQSYFWLTYLITCNCTSPFNMRRDWNEEIVIQLHQEKPLGSIAYHSTIEFYIATKAAIVYKASIDKSPL
jgi:hypothetical protein